MRINSENTELAFMITLLLLRLAIGGAMLNAGVEKFLTGSFSATGYLSNGTGPASGLFQNLVPYGTVLSQLVMWGEMFIGAALISGTVVRLASFWGIVMMLGYYLPYIPPSQGWINQQIVYLFIFVFMMFSGAGYFLGIDSVAKSLEEKRHWLRIFLG